MLLHVCCGPCSTYVIDKLSPEYDLTCFYYNPNIYPKKEYLRRMREFRSFANKMGIGFAAGDYEFDEWFSLTHELKDEKEGGERCDVCYKIRLEKTAEYAAEHDFKHFATTLSVSPRKKADVINRLGSEIADRQNLDFLEADFKKEDGFKRSVEMSKSESMFRQDYCGCFYSKVERHEQNRRRPR
jgi:predicted adenine nucleotide alpha hydrolase (AANH) superfamily ATPase